MGAFLSLRLKWAVDSETILDQGTGNNRVFDRLFRRLELTTRLQPNEALTPFIRPLRFPTILRPSMFDGFSDKIDYVMDENTDAVASVACSEDGRPLFLLKNNDDVMYMVSVRNIAQLMKHLAHITRSEDRYLEIREIIQANRDPLSNISGLSGTPEQVLSKSYEQVQQLMEIITQTTNNPQRETSAALAAARKTFELLLVLNRLDNKLLSRGGGAREKEKSTSKNTMQAIENELRLLQSLCGHESKYPLVSINWESDFRFSTGVRAPPWRQSHGELCYLVVGTHDVGKLVLTCSQEGVFVNKGYYIDELGVERLNYDKASDVSPTITSCLRTQSPHFAAHIDTQDTAFLGQDDDLTDSDESEEEEEEESDFSEMQQRQNQRDQNSRSKNQSRADGGDGLSLEVPEATSPSHRATTADRSHKPQQRPASRQPHGQQQQQQQQHGGSKAQLGGTHGSTAGGKKTAAATGSRKPAGSGGAGQHSGSSFLPPIHGPRTLSEKWSLLQLDNEEHPKDSAHSQHWSTKTMVLNKTPRGPASPRSPTAAGGRRNQQTTRITKRAPQDESSSEEEYGDEIIIERTLDKSEVSTDYTQINKLVKFLKTGTQRATIIALVALRDFDLTDIKNQLAVKDVGGLEPLINLLSSSNSENSATSLRLRLGAAALLKDVALNTQIQIAIAQLGGIPPLVDMLKDNSDQAKCIAAETLANLARNARNRSIIRKNGGIRALVGLLKGARTRTDVKDAKEVPRSAALALWACTKNASNKTAVRNAGGIPPLVRLLDSNNPELVIPVAGVLEELAADPRNSLEIRETDKTVNPPGAIRLLVHHLSSNNLATSTQAAAALYQLGEDDGVRRLVHEYKGLEVLARLLQGTEPNALEKVTGAVWKLAASSDNALVFNQLDVIPRLVQLFETSTESIQINVAGALWNCAKIPSNRVAIRNANGLQALVKLLTSTNHHVLINVTGALWASGLDPVNMRIICDHDGLRLLWSLLKSPNPKVQANAAGAIGPCMDDPKNVADVGRSFVGALSILIGLLSSEDEDVQANVCAAISKIAQDEENLAVITEDGVLPLLARLTSTRAENVRKQLAYAICRCSPYGKNREQFGRLGAVVPLVEFLRSQDPEVHRATAMALEKLSEHPSNSLAMWNAGAVPLLMHLIGKTDEMLQEAAASTISNIRRFHT